LPVVDNEPDKKAEKKELDQRKSTKQEPRNKFIRQVKYNYIIQERVYRVNKDYP
jgi:hypothetical protein